MKIKDTNQRSKPLHNPFKKKPKSKKKSKSKSKEKRFNPVDYLNALIDLQNTTFSTNKKKGLPKRDISSALTIATPALQKTLSSTKIRSKSSFSQYRKKNNGLKEAMTINLKDIITEENVQFTENSARSKNQSILIEKQKINMKRNENACAIIIQRAWRNYKTFRMIKKYYLFSKSHEQNKPEQKRVQQMKIKKEQTKKEQSLPSEKKSSQSYLSDIKEKQQERWNEVIQIIRKQSKNRSKEQLLEQLIEKFQQNKRILEKDIQEELKQSQAPIINIKSESSDRSLKSIEKININEMVSEESFLFDHENVQQTQPQFKIFQKQLWLLSEKKKDQIERVKSDANVGKLNSETAIVKKEQIHEKYEKEKKQVEKSKKQYLFAVTQLKKNTLQLCKNASFLSKSRSRLSVRKSFSAGNFIIKSIISDLNQFQIIDSQSSNSIVLKNQTPKKGNMDSFFSNQLSSHLENTQMMKECSREIEDQIEKFLLQEFVSECYINDHLYSFLKPYVEQIYQFKKITDQQILQFAIRKLPEHYPPPKQLLRRVNQKINPTSLQILRIIRDLDYQIDQYELIVPEECYKKYRSDVEKDFAETSIKFHSKVKAQGTNFDLIEKVLQRAEDKKQKFLKYHQFERDLKIMYMKSVFNCFNEYLIEAKSSFSHLNSRSSIGPGQLTLAIKQYNDIFTLKQVKQLFTQVFGKVKLTLVNKCQIPSFKDFNELDSFQKKLMEQIKLQYEENQYKWINYMDEVLEIWQDLCVSIIEDIVSQAVIDIHSIF